MRRNGKPIKADPLFVKEIEDINRFRFNNIDSDLSKPIGIKRLTEGIVKFPEWNIIKDKLKKEPRKDQIR